MNQKMSVIKSLDVNNLPRSGWVRVNEADSVTLNALAHHYSLSPDWQIRSAVDQADFALLPISLPVWESESAEGPRFTAKKMIIAFNESIVITVEPDELAGPLDLAEQIVARMPVNASILRVLVQIIESLDNSMQDDAAGISLWLNDLADEAVDSSGGFKVDGRQVGVADIAQTAVAIGEAEEFIARTVEGQLMLERAYRWVRRSEPSSGDRDAAVLSDIQSGRVRARFQHSRVGNIQRSLMTTLDLKQNQIIKVFTVITAVFTPPTLIASYYGQNFAHMPELSFRWAEWFVMGATALFALVPLIYIKRKGWLR